MPNWISVAIPAVVSVLLSVAAAAWVIRGEISDLDRRVASLAEAIQGLDPEGLRQIQSSLVNALPPGTVLVSHRRNVDPRLYGEDWVRCGDAAGTPVLEDRFLVGATYREVGTTVGSETHTHDVTGQTATEADGYRSDRAGAAAGRGPHTTNPYWQHRHNLEEAKAHDGGNIPPAVKVLFLCRKVSEPA